MKISIEISKIFIPLVNKHEEKLRKRLGKTGLILKTYGRNDIAMQLKYDKIKDETGFWRSI